MNPFNEFPINSSFLSTFFLFFLNKGFWSSSGGNISRKEFSLKLISLALLRESTYIGGLSFESMILSFEPDLPFSFDSNVHQKEVIGVFQSGFDHKHPDEHPRIALTIRELHCDLWKDPALMPIPSQAWMEVQRLLHCYMDDWMGDGGAGFLEGS